MKNYVIRIDKGIYPPHVNFLKQELDFNELVFYNSKQKRLINKKNTLVKTLNFSLFILKNLGKIRLANKIVCFGWVSIFIKILIKLKIIRCKEFFWLGFFIHNKKFFPVLRFIFSLTAIDQEKYIINSEVDRSICRENLNIPDSKLAVLPYGDFSSSKKTEQDIRDIVGDYYFAGGFTNRDYHSLIESFRQLPHRLVIVGSHLNKDLEVELPSNIEVRQDVPKKEFLDLVKYARACILPLKNETMVSGQMVVQNYMKQGKAIIASDMQVTREYLESGVSAIFYRNALKELPQIITRFDQDTEAIVQLGVQANQQYEENLGGDTLKKRLHEIITSVSE